MQTQRNNENCYVPRYILNDT